jgi:hypothetical protein
MLDKFLTPWQFKMLIEECEEKKFFEVGSEIAKQGNSCEEL